MALVEVERVFSCAFGFFGCILFFLLPSISSSFSFSILVIDGGEYFLIAITLPSWSEYIGVRGSNEFKTGVAFNGKFSSKAPDLLLDGL